MLRVKSLWFDERLLQTFNQSSVWASLIISLHVMWNIWASYIMEANTCDVYEARTATVQSREAYPPSYASLLLRAVQKKNALLFLIGLAPWKPGQLTCLPCFKPDLPFYGATVHVYSILIKSKPQNSVHQESFQVYCHSPFPSCTTAECALVCNIPNIRQNKHTPQLKRLLKRA